MRRRDRRPFPRAWLVLLAVVAATLPIAALDERGSTRAVAADAPVQTPPPAPAPPKPKRPAPPPPIESRVTWRDSVAHGSANSGWLQRGVLLPEHGPGFYTYNPNTQEYPNAPERRYGTAALVRDVIALGKWWRASYPDDGRLGIGDLAFHTGGSLDNHASHENGLDVDIRLPRRDGLERGSDPSTYSRERTQAIVDYLTARGHVQYIFYGPNLNIRGGGPVMVWPNHDDHLHVRISDPDGYGN